MGKLCLCCMLNDIDVYIIMMLRWHFHIWIITWNTTHLSIEVLLYTQSTLYLRLKRLCLRKVMLNIRHVMTSNQLLKYYWGDFIHWVCCTPVSRHVQYIPRNMRTVFALLCFVVVIHWLIFPYPSGLLHWHCGNLTIAPVPAKQPWWIWINTSCEFIMNDCITTTKQSTTKPCAYFLGYTVRLFDHGKHKYTSFNMHNFVMICRGRGFGTCPFYPFLTPPAVNIAVNKIDI